MNATQLLFIFFIVIDAVVYFGSAYWTYKLLQRL